MAADASRAAASGARRLLRPPPRRATAAPPLRDRRLRRPAAAHAFLRLHANATSPASISAPIPPPRCRRGSARGPRSSPATSAAPSRRATARDCDALVFDVSEATHVHGVDMRARRLADLPNALRLLDGRGRRVIVHGPPWPRYPWRTDTRGRAAAIGASTGTLSWRAVLVGPIECHDVDASAVRRYRGRDSPASASRRCSLPAARSRPPSPPTSASAATPPVRAVLFGRRLLERHVEAADVPVLQE